MTTINVIFTMTITGTVSAELPAGANEEEFGAALCKKVRAMRQPELLGYCDPSDSCVVEVDGFDIEDE